MCQLGNDHSNIPPNREKGKIIDSKVPNGRGYVGYVIVLRKVICARDKVDKILGEYPHGNSMKMVSFHIYIYTYIYIYIYHIYRYIHTPGMIVFQMFQSFQF